MSEEWNGKNILTNVYGALKHLKSDHSPGVR